MSAGIVNVSFGTELLNKLDSIAKQEARSRSELIREAMRVYIERKARWNDIFSFGDAHLKKEELTEAEIVKEIKIVRKSK